MGRFRAHGRTGQRIKQGEYAIETPFIQQWLEKPDKLVTRRELYEFVARLERGRARAQTWYRRLGWLLQRAWNYLKRSPLETAEQVADQPKEAP